MPTSGIIRGDKFADYLIRRSEHLDTEIIQDVTPVDGWIGHVRTGQFPVFDGVEHTFDRLNDVYPDLSGCWNDLQAGSCLGTPCDPDEKVIGMGSTRDSYKLQQKSWRTQLFCFDLIMSADRARQQFAHLVQNLRMASNIIVSDRMRMEAWEGVDADNLLTTNVVGSVNRLSPFTFTKDSECVEFTMSQLPNSLLNINMLQQQVVPLRMQGAAGSIPAAAGMFELVTDIETAWQLREGNTSLTDKFRFSDFAQGGDLYKFGITDAIGNFLIRIDPHPVRFIDNGSGVLVRVFPYKNVAATNGIKRIVNPEYIDAPYQISMIWHRDAMVSLVRDAAPVNENMPFAVRDFGGKWMFAMDNLGCDETGRPIENTRRNKGLFLADFSFATKWDYREWCVAYLHRRETACASPTYPCGDDPAYVEQDYSSDNAECAATFDFTFELPASSGLTINAVQCNGVPQSGITPGPHASAAAVATELNTNAGLLGTWAGSGTTLTLTGSTCNDVDVNITA